MQIQNKWTLRDDLSSSQRQKVSALKSSNSEPTEPNAVCAPGVKPTDGRERALRQLGNFYKDEVSDETKELLLILSTVVMAFSSCMNISIPGMYLLTHIRGELILLALSSEAKGRNECRA